MFAVDSLPGVAALDNLGIPESGDGISDVMQEAKWEADYLAKMQDTDGGFYFLVYPQNREYESNVMPDHGDPRSSGPKRLRSPRRRWRRWPNAPPRRCSSKTYPARRRPLPGKRPSSAGSSS